MTWNAIEDAVLTNDEVIRLAAPTIERISADILAAQSASEIRSKLASKRRGTNRHPWTEEELLAALRAKGE